MSYQYPGPSGDEPGVLATILLIILLMLAFGWVAVS